jgi:hypothetical protein
MEALLAHDRQFEDENPQLERQNMSIKAIGSF